MTGMMDKIKGKLLEGWSGLFSGATPAPGAESVFSAQTLYYLFHPRGPVAASAISKASILEGAQRIGTLLARNKDEYSPDHMIFLMAYREFQNAINESGTETDYTFEDKLLIPLYNHTSIIARTIDKLAARQQALKGDGGLSFLKNKAGIDDLQQDINALAHFNNRIGTLFAPGDIAEKARLQRREIQRDYAGHSPFLPKEWRIL